MRILVINGPNLNMLHKREVLQYGNMGLKEIEEFLTKEFPEDKFIFYQTNEEGIIINEIQKAEKIADGIIINPGGFAHTSVAIRDALQICKLPKVEVHISNLSNRENFRQNLLTASACNGYISGFKEFSYYAGIHVIKRIVK